MAKIYIISDCHGNIDGLMRALEAKRIVDKNGRRQLPRKDQVVSIGDLANCVGDSIDGDLECLNLVGEVIDTMLIGNHEIPYIDPANKFWGFVWDDKIDNKIETLLSNDLIGPALLIGETLVTHAGVSRHFAGRNSAEDIFNKMNDHWNARNYNYSLFSSIGYARGGNSEAGGALWCDFEHEFVPTDFPQIVGHTPKYVRMRENTLCIDVGAKDQETEPFILEVV